MEDDKWSMLQIINGRIINQLNQFVWFNSCRYRDWNVLYNCLQDTCAVWEQNTDLFG